MNENFLIINLKYFLLFYIMIGVGFVLFLIFVYSYWVVCCIKKLLSILLLGFIQMIQGNYSICLFILVEKEFVQIGEMFNYMVDVIENIFVEKCYVEESKQWLIVDLLYDLKILIIFIQGYVQVFVEGWVENQDRQQCYLGYIYNKFVQVV